MLEEITAVLAVLAFSWSAIQEYRINKMCEKCPFLPKNRADPSAESQRS